MATQLATAAIAPILPKIIRKGLDLKVAESRFLKEINQAKAENAINPGGAYTPYMIEDNDTAFGVAEGGPILGGAAPEYTIGSVNIRAHWSSIEWTGKIERIKSQYLTAIQRDPRFAGMTMPELADKARNIAVKDHVFSALKTYAQRENRFALQGTDKSPIGTVTDLPTSLGGSLAANTVGFSWDTTPQGNRWFSKSQMIEFRDGSGGIRNNGLSADYITVDQKVDKTAANGDDGPVHFDGVPTDLAVDDTAHFRNAYGMMPTGVYEYVDDVGEFKGITRSDDPDSFESVIIRLSGSPTIAPLYVRQLISRMISKVGYGTPLKLVFWMCKTQRFNWESQVYNSPFTRFIGPGQVKDLDMSVDSDTLQWDGKKFNIDRDVPPADFLALNMMAWNKITQTPVQVYIYDTNSPIVNVVNSDGDRLDAKRSTIFSEYNWDLDDCRSQGRIEGFAFNRAEI